MQTTPTRTALRFGLIVGLGLIIYGLILQVAKLQTNALASWGSTLFLIIGLIFAMQDYKKNNEGYLTYGEGLTIGSLTSAIAGFMSGLFTFVYISFIDNSFVDETLQKLRIDLEKQGQLTDDQIDKVIEMSAYMLKPGVLFALGVVFTLIFGFVFSLIISAILKKNKPVF
ncbi:MAG: DUF4199 domain-containing protein [Microscillaceae bacterium]|nr:DUF4199 domain-containing protein [Microscillaceae bacterium]MDW8459600.1 DUF4199 domain-containing protein [Cytophagales bacterium]